MKKRKSIAYAYPTSIAATRLGFKDTGCYYVQEEIQDDDNGWKSYIPHNAEGFAEPDARDLISLFAETDGEPLSAFPQIRKYQVPRCYRQRRLDPTHT